MGGARPLTRVYISPGMLTGGGLFGRCTPMEQGFFWALFIYTWLGAYIFPRFVAWVQFELGAVLF